MNIGIISFTASYHHLAQLLTKSANVFHYGANKSLVETDNYHPRPKEIAVDKFLPDDQVGDLLSKIKKDNLDYILASGVSITANKSIHRGLKELNIPYFFPSSKLVKLELHKGHTKKMLDKLDIPNSPGILTDGKYLYNNFKTLARPFVVKLNFFYQYGRQTYIVNDDNYEEVFLDLFSDQIGNNPRITNIRFNTSLVIEDFVKIKREYSYHILVNSTGWQYFGSARDYKRFKDNDCGFNTVSMGSYNVDDIDPRVHDYADKIVNNLKNKGHPYKGFMFIGIAEDKDGVPIVLEINTRSGDPELQVILSSIENNLADLFKNCSMDLPIPNIVHNKKKSVTIRLINNHYDWRFPASHLPKISTPPEDIIFSLEGTNDFKILHSLFTTSDKTHELASKKLYQFLDKQNVGQYIYRKDIGILK
jgi:phosphoribosylamine-glycine ligase